MKKILVPVDFSDQSHHALDFAIQFNQKINGEIILLHVVELPHINYSDLGHASMEVIYRDQYIKGVHSQLEKLAFSVADHGQKVKIKQSMGKVAQKILEFSKEESVNWIIQGASEHGKLEGFVSGSIFERIVRHAECPVITIKEKVNIDKFENMLLCSNLDEKEDWIAYNAKDYQELFNCKLQVLKVDIPSHIVPDNEVKNQLDAYAKRNFLHNYKLYREKSDYPEEGILNFLKNHDTDIIFIGTHGYTGLGRLLHGAYAEAIVNHAHKPVITMKIPEYSK